MSKIISISSVDDIKNNEWNLYTNKELVLGNYNKEQLLILHYEKGAYLENSEVLYVITSENSHKDNAMALSRINKFCNNKQIKLQIAKTKNTFLINEIREEWKRKTTQDVITETSTNEIKKAEEIIEKALRLNASDIHIEKREDNSKAKVRYRVNGLLMTYDYMYGHEASKMARIFYQVFTAKGGESGKTFDEKSNLNGLFDREINNKRVRVRISVLHASPNGFDMVLRLLPYQADGSYQELKDLGYSKSDTSNIKFMLGKSVGLTVIAGTTGSGKSTTLKNLIIKYIRDSQGNIKAITIEDPPEYYIPNATQVPVNRENSKDEGRTEFASAIRQAMRSDPNLMMIGEIRDGLTAKVTVEAAQTGHKVLTTIHAASAFGILDRLIDLGVSHQVLSSPNFISGLIYQKLLPVLCEHCSTKIENDEIPKRINYEYILNDRYTTYEVDPEIVMEIKSKNDHDNETLLDELIKRKLLKSSQADEIIRLHRSLNNEEINNELLERLKAKYPDKLHNIRFKGKGCEHCRSGIVGRMVVAETVRPDMEMYLLLSKDQKLEAMKYWKEKLGGTTVQEDAEGRMLEGLVDPFDLEAELSLIGSEE